MERLFGKGVLMNKTPIDFTADFPSPWSLPIAASDLLTHGSQSPPIYCRTFPVPFGNKCVAHVSCPMCEEGK